MTHPLKKFSPEQIQNAFAEALKTLTGATCDIRIESIDFQESLVTSINSQALISLQAKITPIYSEGDLPF